MEMINRWSCVYGESVPGSGPGTRTWFPVYLQHCISALRSTLTALHNECQRVYLTPASLRRPSSVTSAAVTFASLDTRATAPRLVVCFYCYMSKVRIRQNTPRFQF